ncbi:hypothetical protein [Microbulbifer yueqingensis]|uniref:hypothetical protein n=1 Tax=Microbulbifer yueqingensis TaxID=658219 RepID=UPI001113B1B9|nr:hypothetical protein [Microbulbifer yueqingensis]
MQRIFEKIYRIFCGCLLCFFAFAPGWIAAHVIYALVVSPREITVEALVALGVCLPLLYFLLLLAFRAFTGIGRHQDGGLLPPWGLQVFASLMGVIAILIIYFGWLKSDLAPILGGLAYISVSLAVYRIAQARKGASKISA